jgi:hypothetical protein
MRRAQLRLRQIKSIVAAGFFIVAAGAVCVPRPGGIRWF